MTPPLYDRALLLHGSKRNQVLTLSEIEQYGVDSFGDPGYVGIYGMPPHAWYRLGIRLLGRTAVECTRDVLGDRIGHDVATIAARIPSTNPVLVVDPFAGSCNTLFWILRHLPNAEGIAFESDFQVYELTRRNLSALGQPIRLIRGDYVELLKNCEIPADRSIVTFVAPPWGAALDEVKGLDLRLTTPPLGETVDRISQRFTTHGMLFAIQVYENVETTSLSQLRAQFDWTELRIYDINQKGGNHGLLIGTRGWTPG